MSVLDPVTHVLAATIAALVVAVRLALLPLAGYVGTGAAHLVLLGGLALVAASVSYAT